MTKKIIYFTAGRVATAGEIAEANILKALCDPGFSLSIRNGAESASYGNGIESCDLVAGTIPTAFNAKDQYGSISADRPLAFDIWPKTATIAPAATLQLYPVEVTGASLDVVDAAAVASSVAYASSDATKATVHASTGLVTAVAAGPTTITATYTYETGKTITATSVITVS